MFVFCEEVYYVPCLEVYVCLYICLYCVLVLEHALTRASQLRSGSRSPHKCQSMKYARYLQLQNCGMNSIFAFNNKELPPGMGPPGSPH